MITPALLFIETMPNLFHKLKKQSQAVVPTAQAPQSSASSLFLLLILGERELQAALVGRDRSIKSFSPIKSYFDRQDLVTQADQALQDLGAIADDVSDCIFVFDQAWLEAEQLPEPKKVLIQELSEALSLNVLGQFSISEGLHQARIAADAYDSALFLYLRDENFDLILIKHGQLLTNLTIGRSGSLAADLQEGLARIGQDLGEEGKYFPNKVYLLALSLNHNQLSKEQEQLANFDWAKVSSFLQVPSFSALESDYLIKAIALAAAQSLAKPASASSFGIQFNQDLQALTPDEQQLANVQTPAAQDISLIEASENQVKKAKSAVKKSGEGRWRHFWLKNRRALLIGAGSGLLALLLLFSVFTLFLSKVKVKITPAEQLLQKQLLITLDPQLAQSDYQRYLLKASVESKELAGQDNLATTGISQVGELAKGKVKIFNKTDEEQTLAAGSSVSTDDLSFTLDQEVTIEAAVEDTDGGGVAYGSVEAALTAEQIGADSNLNKDTKLRVADYYDDTFSAVVMDNFTGGSSREVQVVSAEDMNNLADQLKTALAAEAAKEFNDESTDGVYLVPTGNSQTVDFSYNHQDGDETDNLSLEMKMRFDAIKYTAEDLKQLAQAVLAQDLPEHYVFVDQEPSLMSDQAVADADRPDLLRLNAELSAKAIADLKAEELNSSLLGKTQEEARQLLSNNDLIKNFTLIYQPPFMAELLTRLPNKAERLQIIFE